MASDEKQVPAPIHWPLIIAGCFAVLWIVHRALVQSITLDEADTFHHWVATALPSHWESHSNNHVLNSTLMRVSIWLFGLGHFAVRAPALLGGLVYIYAASRLCLLLASGRAFTCVLFLCLVYNPFIMDYLVAARGYGLALGFLSLGLYLLAEMIKEPSAQRLAGISACAGLAICANFSFAFASTFLLLVAGVPPCLALFSRTNRLHSWARLLAAWTLPACASVLVLAGAALTRFPRDQLFWGTHTWAETWQDIREASFVELNPQIINPLLATLFHAFDGQLLRAIAVCVILYLFLLFISMYYQPAEVIARYRLWFAAGLTSILALTISAHWLQLKFLRIPLPFERTSVFFVPLVTALVGTVLSIVPANSLQRAVRGVGFTLLTITGLYFVGELRDSYFREWRIGADVQAAFPTVVDVCRRTGVHAVVTDWNLVSSFNFYRLLYKTNNLDELSINDKMPAGRPIYVLQESMYTDFIRQEGLQAVWHGSASDLLVLIRPGTPGTGTLPPP